MRRNRYIHNKIVQLKTGINKRLRRSREENLGEAKQYTDKAWKVINDGMKAFGKEANETEEMAISFFRLLEHKLNLNERDDPPTEEEVKKAIEQLKDVGRFSLFTTMVIIPGGVISLVGLELLARKLGLKDFTLVPSSFKKKKARKENQELPELPEDTENPQFS